MSKLKDFYQRSQWNNVFHFRDDRGSARSYLLFASITQAMVNGLTTGVFYSGYLGSFGINIVSISILTMVPYIASFLSLLSPVILERFKKRRVILTVSRIAYFTINILGLTILPLVVQSQQGRMIGLVIIVFLPNAINYLFTSGYSAWHMGYIDPEVRSGYMTATNLVANAASGLFLLVAGAVTDRLEGQSQQYLLMGLRCLSFGIAMADVYFLQKPKEPEHRSNATKRVSLASALTVPLGNKRFMLIMSVSALQGVFGTLINSVVSTWLLEDVKVSYTYINFINLTYVFFILPTSALWGKSIRKRGTLGTLALAQMLMVPSYFLHALMTESNYLWVMTAVKLIQNSVSLGTSISVSSLIYIALPEENQTCYLSFYQILGNLSNLLGLSVGTWVVAAMGDTAITILGFRFTSVPVLFLVQAVLFAGLSFYVRWVGKKVEPNGYELRKHHFHLNLHLRLNQWNNDRYK